MAKIFDDKSRRRIGDTVKHSERTRGPGRRSGPAPVFRDEPILAKITAVDIGNAQFTANEVMVDGEDKANGLTWDGGAAPNLPKLIPVNKVPWVPVDTVCQVFLRPDSSDPPVMTWCVVGFGVGATFAVDLTQTDGGAGGAGDAETECDFTYTVDDLGGNELGTAVSPEHARPALGKMVAATVGTAYWLADGAFKLLWTDEQPDTGAC